MRPRLGGPLVSLMLLASPLWAEAPLTVEIVAAKPSTDRLLTELTGTIEAPESFTVAFRSSGRISEIAAEVGDLVSEGEVLARLDALQADAALRSAEAGQAAAKADLVQAEQTRDRARALLNRGAGTNADFEAAQAQYIAAEAAKDQAAAQVETAKQGLEDTEIRAPAPGIVTHRSAEVGQVVGAAQPVLTIAPEGRREAVFYAPNIAALDQMIGRAVTITLLDDSALQFGAEISEVSPLADAKTGTVIVKARLTSAEDEATRLLGVPVSSHIELEMPELIALPWSTLVLDDGKPAVWTVDPASGTVSLRPVVVARYTTSSVEIEAGITAGELVVAKGSNLLYPGRQVVAGEGAK